MSLSVWLLAPLSCQVAAVDLLPPELLPLGGYTARQGKLMEQGGEPLFARTLLLRQGDLKVAIVSLEMLTVPESLVAAVQQRVDKGTRLMLVASHTHSAPDSQMLNDRMTFAIPGIASYKSRWLEWYADRIAGSIKLAAESPVTTPRTWSISQSAVKANRARRDDAKPNEMSTGIWTDRRLAIIHYSAHATIYEEDRNTTSGDWPGELMRATKAIFLPGAIGDVSPAPQGRDSVEKMEWMVENLSNPWPVSGRQDVKVSRHGLAYCQVPIDLPEPRAHAEFISANKVPEPLAQVLVKRFAAPQAVVTAVRIGGIVLVGIPGEPTSQIGADILTLGRKKGFPHPLVVSHTNGWLGYILEPVDYDRGGYEATLAFHGRGFSQAVIAAAAKALDQLR